MKTIPFLKLFTILCAIFISTSTISQKSNKIPVTTNSKEALKLYQLSITSMEKVKVAEAMEQLNNAVEKDPDFFMGYFNLAMNHLNFGNEELFKKIATKAITLDIKLNNAEELYKQLLERLLKDQKSDVTDLCEKIVKLYPKDYYAYVYLGYFSNLVGKFDEGITNMKKALELTKNKAPIYNMLGYSYLGANKMKEAEECFNKYIDMEPKEANPYDSKGDYFMAMKDYQNAYDSFMKAYEIDNVNFKVSLEKAKKAKKLMEQTNDK